MWDARRLIGRLFCFAVLAGAVAVAQGPARTTVADTVYRADGTVAAGELLISWPAFNTLDGHAVAAGMQTVTLGAGGALSVQLVPNAGATPLNTPYTVVYQLNDGTVKTEYWSVPTTSPATLTQVRTTLGTTGTAGQLATQQFVNAALAGKANDSAVVHNTGNEAVAGIKSFSASPSFPTPVQGTDAANKAYVDSAVTTGGSGSFLSTAGGTLTGPLTLSGDPTAPQQAADRHYVDAGLAVKADLLGGVVPANELATGTANSSTCLLGNSTWGACGGSSSNAASIQNVPVDTTAPTDNQVITYVASLGKYEPRPGGGVTAGMQAVKYAPDFSWAQTPSTNLGTPGAVTVTLAACPAGVLGNEPQYYVYVAGTGTAEAVLVTGGTCAGNGLTGTLQFTTVNPHPAGYTVGSASGGLQEVVIAARFTPTNPAGTSQSGKVIVPPGEFKAYARVSIRAANMTVDLSGSIVECWMNDTCLFVGDPANSNAYNDITLINPRGRPMIVGGLKPFIEVNAQKTRVMNVTTRTNTAGGTFGSYVQVDDDQAFLLDGLDTSLGYGLRCDATACSPAVYAPGPFNVFSAVGWLKNMNISLQCGGNGVDWESGNSVRISDSVIQGYNQYGVRGGTKRGGYAGIQMNNVYEEASAVCSNPLGNVGQAGVILQGSELKIQGGVGPSGLLPVFANTGTTEYRYYVVAHHATLGASNLLLAGKALTNGTGNITVTTPDIPGASTFDVLRITAGAVAFAEQAPYGTGNYAVVAGVSRASACSNGVCTFTDTQAALQGYTVAALGYYPLLTYWPASMVLSGNQDLTAGQTTALAFVEDAPSMVATVMGGAAPSVVAQRCASPGYWTPMWLSCATTDAPQTQYAQEGLLLAVKPNQDGGLATNMKGRVNFSTLGSAPSHIITLSDSNFQKTIATSSHRASNDLADAFIGYDQGDGNPGHIGISFGAPLTLSNYIGNVGDGTNWLERLTANLKEFKTSVQVDSGLTVAGTITANGFAGSGSAPLSLQGGFGTLTTAPAGKSLLGFGTGGVLQISQNGGGLVQVATLDAGGNLAATTATQLAAAPAQCNGTFATGIQANGNANCGTADVVQLAETAEPTGIANFGLFWFDSTLHVPFFKENGVKAQLGFTNLFNTDLGTVSPNTVEVRNGANTPQAVRVYRSYDDAADWERVTLGYDGTSKYVFVGEQSLGTPTGGNTPSGTNGLGFMVGNSVRWVIDASGAAVLKPVNDNVYSIGTIFNAPASVFAKTSFDMYSNGRQDFELANDGTTGTTASSLAKYSAAGLAVAATTADTDGVIGIVSGGAGTTGKAVITWAGIASCNFDGSPTNGDWVVASVSSAGKCHDTGSTTRPTSGQVIGRIEGGLVRVGLDTPAGTGGGGAVTSVFGRTGAVVAGSGDYTVAQVTGAAALASPGLTGTPTAPTAAVGTNTTQVATTAFVLGQASTTTPSADGTGAVGTATTFARADHVHPTDASRVATSTTVNGHALSGNVTVAPADLTAGALASGMTATTQSVGDNSTKLATTAYVRSEIYGAWACPVGGTTSTTQYCNWTLPAGLTITGFDLAASTAAVGCTTFPVIQVWDGTASAEVGSYSITFTSATNFYTQVTGSSNVAAGHLLRVKITTAAVGCTTAAGNVVATVTYQMQN